MAIQVADLVVVTVALASFLALRRQKRLYPPGPKRLPLLGNLLDLPRENLHKKFAQWSKELDSDIIYLDAAGMPIIVLNSHDAATDLLDKRSAIYSSRIHLTMGCDLVEGHRFFVMMPYGNEWRESRQLMAKHITAPDKPSLSCARDFVRKGLLPNFLDSPEDFLIHIRNGVGGSILSLTYGLRIRRVDDPWIALAGQALKCVTSATVPGKYAVDALPFLKYLPEWFPGAGFQREARESRAILRDFFSKPFEAAKRRMDEGTLEPCFISETLGGEGEEGSKKYEKRMIENVAGMFSAGGTDTAVTSMMTLMAVFLLYPNVQAKAQEEIDRVIGRHRLPDFNDKANLPYLRALLKELLRWQPTVPAGFPHMSTEDDTYRGYFIPKNSIVIGNTWAIFHDESNFPNPSNFDPTRFLTSTGELRTDDSILDPEVVATFGFGRRICPGSEFGLAGLWIAAASVLACFNVSPALDDDGKEEVPRIEFLGKEVVSHPEPFRCRITPRSKEAEALIRAEYDETSEYI